MSSTVQVSTALVELIQRYLEQRQADVPALSAELAALRRQQRMPIDTWWRLLKEVSVAVPDPATGLAVGALLQPRDFGVLGYLAAACATLGQVLERFQRYQALIHNLSASKLTHQEGTSQISWDPSLGKSTQTSDEVVAAGLLALARNLTGIPSLSYASVAFIGRPQADLSIYERRLGCPVSFGSRTHDLIFSDAVLALPIASSDPYLMALMEQQAKTLLQILPQPDALMSQLQQALMDTLQDGEPTCDRIATLLGLSERTLNRRLQERGTSYKGILTDLRRQLVTRYLADAQLSLADIAHLLGYSEQSALTRAFKHWFGETPLRYRRTLLDNAGQPQD